MSWKYILLPLAIVFADAGITQPADTPTPRPVLWVPGQITDLAIAPPTPLTVMLEPGERIVQITLDAAPDIEVSVTPSQDAFIIAPAAFEVSGTMQVNSDRRVYRFALRTVYGAEPLVRVVTDPALLTPRSASLAFEDSTTSARWRYRIRGDRVVRPASVIDDGSRTQITFAQDQALPAVFAKGPSGKEEVVNGYMRDDVYVIDRTYRELVFRVDRKRATAKRNDEPEAAP